MNYETEDRVLTLAEAASRMGCSVDSIRRLVRSGKLSKTWMTEFRWGIRLSDVRAAQTRTTPENQPAA